MKRAIYQGIRQIRVEEVYDEPPGPGAVQVRIKYCGICGSDLHEYLHGAFPQPVFGHEACGTITAVGPGVSAFTVGQRVCSVFPGAFTESLLCPAERLIPIPDDMSWERAALLEPFSGAAYAIARGGVRPEHTVFVAGAGPVGLMILLGLKASGVRSIFMTDLQESRRRLAAELGATHVWDPSRVKSSARAKELTQGRGVDVAIEAVGIEASLKDCLTSVRQQGTVLVQGIFTQRVPVHMFGFVVRETTMIGCNATDFELALSWLSKGSIQPERIVTDIIPLEAIASQGFEALALKKEGAIKILVAP
jgi:(R,R)-butanediol dehydrogenase/meso-butanediol dehydrogenase/diacetyl reductase